jgi:hypothetical protein
MTTIEYLLHGFIYDPQDGRIYDRLTFPIVARGKLADLILNPYGYRMITLNGTQYFAHRAAFVFMTGDWPKQHVDHIDGVRLNNIWANLRDVDQSINKQNVRVGRSADQTKLLGVHKHGNLWRAQVNHNGKTVRFGSYTTAEAAHEAYLEGKRKLHQGCTI